MTTQLVAQQAVLFGGYRFTAQTRAIAEAMETARLDATVLGGTSKLEEPGLLGYGVSGSGFWESTTDKGLQGYKRTRNVPISIGLTDGTAGTPARSVKAMRGQWNLTGRVGELFGVDFEFAAMDAPASGTILHHASASGNVTGTAFQVGAVGATQFLRGVLHVFSGTGSFDVLIQSDSAEAFTTPTTRITFANVATGTPITYEWATPIAGAITDDWWRISATNPNTRDFAVIMAIE